MEVTVWKVESTKTNSGSGTFPFGTFLVTGWACCRALQVGCLQPNNLQQSQQRVPKQHAAGWFGFCNFYPEN